MKQNNNTPHPSQNRVPTDIKPGFSLDKALLNFKSDKGISVFTIRNAVEGIQIFGGIGAGKTSASGRLIALQYLKAGFGGLVLAAKTDERKLWEEYCRITNRSEDLIIVEPGGRHCFNFLEYESSGKSNKKTYTDNIVQVLKTVLRASEEKSGGKSDDPFWEVAQDMLITNAIDLCLLACGFVTIDLLYSIVLTAPKKEAQKKSSDSPGGFNATFKKAQENVIEKINAMKKSDCEEATDYGSEQVLLDRVPEARVLKFLDQFFLDHYRDLSDKTRSIVEFSFVGFLFRLMKEPFRSLFNSPVSTFKPEDCFEGKIILLDLPVKEYHHVGRDAQVMFKYIWQRAMEKRTVSDDTRPVFLWADEAQHFLHEYDAEYQATARSSRIATVYLSQNLANYHANMGGIKSEYRVKSFLGTLGTKIFHANADVHTNQYASDLIGEGWDLDISKSLNVSGEFSAGKSESYKLQKMVRPEAFNLLRTGGPENNSIVDAYIHRQGALFSDGLPFSKLSFSQH